MLSMRHYSHYRFPLWCPFNRMDAMVPLACSAPIQSDIRLLLTLGSCSSRGRIRHSRNENVSEASSRRFEPY